MSEKQAWADLRNKASAAHKAIRAVVDAITLHEANVALAKYTPPQGDYAGAHSDKRVIAAIKASVDCRNKAIIKASTEGATAINAEIAQWPDDYDEDEQAQMVEAAAAVLRAADAADDCVRVPRKKLTELSQLMNEQAEDDMLWFQAVTITEAHLQNELRQLTAFVEAMIAAHEAQKP